MIHLEKVTEKTFSKLLSMKLSEEQNRFVAPNVVSLAQAWLCYDFARPYAICEGDETVGFIMLDWDEGERTVGIWRFMIDTPHQGKGYGKQAMEQALALIRASGAFDMAYLDYVPGNDIARKLYYSMGFRENGDVEDGEIIMTLSLTDTPRIGWTQADEDDHEELQTLCEAARDAGNRTAAALCEGGLKHAIDEKRVIRLTLMGDAVGLYANDTLILLDAHKDRASEALAVIQSLRKSQRQA